jgi:hypothetical protein
VSNIFREEALAELRSRRRPGDVVRASPGWLLWSFALLLVLIGLGATAIFTIHLREEAHGHALVGKDGRSVKVVLPVAFGGDIRRGMTLRLQLGAAHRSAPITSVHVQAGGLVTRARLVPPLRDKSSRTGRGSVRLGSETFFDLLGG